jgi:hypothetical protein
MTHKNYTKFLIHHADYDRKAATKTSLQRGLSKTILLIVSREKYSRKSIV